MKQLLALSIFVKNIIIIFARMLMNLKYGVKAKVSLYSVPMHISAFFAENSQSRPQSNQYDIGSQDFWGAGCISLGDKIYMAPVDGRRILRFDICSKSLKFIETELHNSSPSESTKKLGYTGICQYEDSLYVMPRSANSLIKMYLNNEQTEIIPLKTKYQKEHHYAGVVVADGRLYQPPRDTNHILVINLNNFTVKKIQIGMSKGRSIGKYRYSGVIYHPNGFIYMIPDHNEHVIKLDPRDDSISFIGPFLRESRLIGPAVGKDGNIYGFLMFSGGILKIDVNKNQVEILEKQVVTGCCGTECAINGKLYGVPAYKNEWFEFDIDTQKIKKIGVPDKKSVDNFAYAVEAGAGAGAGAGADGALYTVPCYGNSIYSLQFSNVTNLDKDILDYMENGY